MQISKTRLLWLLPGIVIALASCTRGELPVPVHESGNVTVAGVDMDPTYKYQIYYDLRTNTVVGKNEKTSWDIGLEATAEGYHVVLNGAKSMYAFRTSQTDFAAAGWQDTVGFAAGAKWDSQSGKMDSTAIGDWRSDKPVYILERGYDPAGKHLGWAKLQLLSVSDTGYQLRFAALDGSDETTLAVSKDSAYNLAFVSFTTKNQLTVEPPKAAWDLVFSQYTYVFYDMEPPVPYLVTGCLLNRHQTAAYLDIANAFQSITYTTLTTDKLTEDIGVIGYDWKVYNGSGYVVNAGNSYIIRDADGVYYKLHFTGFYSATGVKGSPQWEYQQL